jgi:chromosome segregation ATPase
MKAMTAALTQLEEERVQLNEELSQARQTLDSQATNLEQLQGELGRVHARLGQAEQEISRLQSEQAALRQGNVNLIDQLTTVVQEKQVLEAKLSSLQELRLAMRSVKQRLREERWQAWLAHVESERAEDQRQLAQGNHGFVVRNGVSTLGARSSLQVRVLQPEASK